MPQPSISPKPAETFEPASLLAYREAAARRRAAAFAAPFDMVGNLRLVPISPASYSRLFATKNAFLGSAPARSGDVRDFIWFHWLGFTLSPSEQSAARSACDAAIAGELTANQSLPDLIREYSLFVPLIREICHESFADAGASGGPRLGATLEAQMIDLFCSEYPSWTPEYVSAQPLRRLFQLIRAMNCRHVGRTYIENDPAEDAIIAAELAPEIAAAQAALRDKTMPAKVRRRTKPRK